MKQSLMTSQNKPMRNIIRYGLVLAILSAIFAVAIFPVNAASGIQITVVAVNPGSDVTLRFDNLPASQTFKVSMGPGGSVGAGSMVATFDTGTGGSLQATFEILADVRSEKSIVVRVDNGAGAAVVASFDNTTAFSSANVTAPSASSAAAGGAVIPVTGAPSAPAAKPGPAAVLHVQKGGWVQAIFNNLPADTLFSVTIGTAGSQGFGGYKVADFKTGSLSSRSGTFEIPVLLSSETSLDLRAEAPGFIYVLTFSNVDK